MAAVAVAVLVGLCVRAAWRSGRAGLRRTAAWLAVLTVCQIALGALTVVSRKSVALTTAHVAAGALLLGSTLALCLAALSAERRKSNVVPIRTAMTGRVAGWM